MRSRRRVVVAGEEHVQLVAVDVGADGQRAARAELGEEAALDLDRVARRRRRRRRPSSSRGRRVVGAALDGDAALADGRHEPRRVEPLGDPLGQPEDLSAATAITIDAAVGHLRQPGGDVAAQLDERAGRAAPRRAGPAGAPSPVATVAPAARSASDRPTSASAASRRARERADRRGRRCGADGRSLAECTATSARPSSTACWTSLTNTPCPPMTCSGTSWRRSPVVSTNTSSTVAPGRRRRSASATASAWVRACGLPRVARRSGGTRRRQCRSNRSLTAAALRSPLRRAGVVAQAHRRAVQQLGDDRPGERLDGVALVVVELGEAAGEPLELAWRARPRRARAAGRRAAPPGGP